MYEILLGNQLPVLLIALLLATFAGWHLGDWSAGIRLFIFDYTLPFAAAFYGYLTLAVPVGTLEVNVASLLFEVALLVSMVKYFMMIRLSILRLDTVVLDQWIRRLVLLQTALVFPLLFLEGFGLFSLGDRNEYLGNYWFAKYLIYAGFLIAAMQIPLVAAKANRHGHFGFATILTIVVNIIISMITGSKGAIFLWLLSILSMIRFDLKVQCRRLLLALIASVVMIFLVFELISNFLELDYAQLVDLLTSRFFLVNDARALVYEYSSTNQGFGRFLAEAFRAISSVLGIQPDEVPLGVQLYRENFGLDIDVGANASLLALVMYYADQAIHLPLVLLAIVSTRVSVLICERLVLPPISPVGRCFYFAITLYLLRLVSQDFFAFQTTVILIVVASLVFWIYRGCRNESMRKRARAKSAEEIREGSLSSRLSFGSSLQDPAV
jgi:hypothetical protein